MPKFAWHRDNHLTKPTTGTQTRTGRKPGSTKAQLAAKEQAGTAYRHTRYVVRDKVSGVYLKVRKSSSEQGNGYAFIKVVAQYGDATKFRSKIEAEHAMKTYVAKLNKKEFREMLVESFGIDVRLGPEFVLVNPEEVK